MENQELDKDVLRLAKTIAKLESRGQKDPYNTKGASGETGAYQFMPATWKEWAGKYLGDPNAPKTVENQNRVAYSRIADRKKAGLTPAQILSEWNSGRADAYKTQKAGVNKHGVRHDVAGYVAKGSQLYRELLEAEGVSAQEMPSEAQNAPSDVSLAPERPDTRSGVARFVGGILRPIGRVAANVLATSELTGALGNQDKFDEIANQRKQFGYDLPLVGNVTPFGTQGFTRAGVKESVGVGAGLASLLPMAKGVASTAKLGVQGQLRRGVITGAQEGLGGGALAGFGDAMEQDRGVGRTLLDTGAGAIAGLAGGSVLGGAFAGAGSAFARLTKPVQERVRNTVVSLGNKILRPSVSGRRTATASKQADERMFEGFQTIYDNLDRLNITDETGKKITAPRNISELQSAVEQSKNIIFKEYNTMAQNAGEAGMRIDVAPIIVGLKREANNVANAPSVRNYYRQLAQEVSELNGQTPEVISARIADLNQSFPQFMQNRVDKSRARADLSVANKLRELMDEGIERYSGPGWQQLRRQYGSLKEIEKDLSRRAIMEARKNNKGFFDLTDVFSGGQLADGIVGLDPASIASAFTMRGIKGYIKSLNDPNRMVNDIFKEMDRAYKGSRAIERTPSRLPQKQLEAPKTDVRSQTSGGILRLPRRTQSTVDKAEQAVVKRPTRGGGLVEKTKKKVKNVIEDIKKDGQRGSAELFKDSGDLTVKTLSKLEGKSTVSKQFISDLSNSGDIKQSERELLRAVLDTFPEDKISVKDFADRVKVELLPLKRKGETYKGGRYENVTLPSEIRGDVKNYKERVYESPITTSAGDIHFSGSKNYFGHTRIEDMADNKTRRVIEVQSDLYQKGNLEKETQRVAQQGNGKWGVFDNKTSDPIGPQFKTETEAKAFANKPIAKLQQYNNPTAHFRMVREEIKKASQDGKTKLQFPTGETAMKIEGLGDNVQFYDVARMNETRANGMASDLQRQGEALSYATLKPTELKVGQEVSQGAGNQWIITDVLGDGKFKAVPKHIMESESIKRNINNLEDYHKETFDISGKVDTNNPIYKFYEKDLGKYLQNKYNAKRITDKNGVSWYEIDVPKEAKDKPVEAFGKAQLGVVAKLGLGSLGAGVGAKAVSEIARKMPPKKESQK